jgi:uncharacterized membrane protein
MGIRIGQIVWITNNAGREQKGRIIAVSGSEIELQVSSALVSYPMHDVQTVQVRDSVWNGTRTGAIAGGVAGGVFFGLLAYGLRCETNCGSEYSTTHDVLEGVLGMGAISAGIGALAGALIDRGIEGRRLVYSSPVVGIAPVVGRGTVGIRATFRFR